MASFFSKLFKPKWQNSSANVRIEAIAELDPSTDQQILQELATKDTNEDVRHAAVERFNDPAVLIKLYPALKNTTRAKALSKTNALSQQLGLNLFDLVEDSSLLAEMIVSSEAPTDFMSGLARLQDEEALLNIATNAQLTRIRQAAAELIVSETHLQKVLEVARSKDKNVFQIAKSKLNTIKERQKQKSEHQEQLTSLLASLEEHARTEDTNLYEAKLESLTQRWNPLRDCADDAQNARYEAFVEQCKVKSLEIKQLSSAQEDSTPKQQTSDTRVSEKATQAPLTEAQTESQNELTATLDTLTSTLNQLKSRPASNQEVSAIDAILKTQETRWIECTKSAVIEKSDEKQYKDSMSQLRQYLSALQKLTENQASLESTLNKSDNKDQDVSSHIQGLVKKINWPDGFAAPEILSSAFEKIESSKENREAHVEKQNTLEAQFQESIKQLDGLLDEKQLNDSKALMQKVRKTYGQLDHKRQNSLSASLKLRTNQLNELRDWQGFAASPQQLRLCEAMEHLTEQHLDPKEKATRIKALQDEWKALGGAREQGVWDRFSAAADKAFEPCAEYFNEQTQLKKANLEKRSTLLEELTTFVEQTDWASSDRNNDDWKAIENINRQARSEWRDAYPVDHKKGKALQDNFNKVLAALEEKLNTERNTNLKLKQNIVERAQALSEAPSDLRSAMQGAKDLQNEWQKIGITEHKKDRALWKAFRKACDSIFAQRDAERNKIKEEASAKLNDAEARLKQASILANTQYTNLPDLESALKQVRQDLKQVNDVPTKDKNRFYDEYNRHIESLKEQKKALSFKDVQQKWAEAARKAEVVYKAFATSATTEESLDSLVPAFTSEHELGKTLESQFKTLWQKVAKANIEELGEAEAQELCIRCEIAAGIDSPSADQERRMQLQVSRLSEGLSNTVNLTREEQLNELLQRWYAESVVSPALREQFSNRIETCIQKVFGATSTTNKKDAPETEGA